MVSFFLLINFFKIIFNFHFSNTFKISLPDISTPFEGAPLVKGKAIIEESKAGVGKEVTTADNTAKATEASATIAGTSVTTAEDSAASKESKETATDCHSSPSDSQATK